MALLNQSLALRDAHNNLEDDDGKSSKAGIFGLWIAGTRLADEMEMEDAVGPIAKKLKGLE